MLYKATVMALPDPRRMSTAAAERWKGKRAWRSFLLHCRGKIKKEREWGGKGGGGAWGGGIEGVG